MSAVQQQVKLNGYDYDVVDDFMSLGGVNKADDLLLSHLPSTSASNLFQALSSYGCQISSHPELFFEILHRISAAGFRRSDATGSCPMRKWFIKQIEQRYEFIDSKYPALSDTEEAGRLSLMNMGT
jgi:hypothetical protein